MIASTGRGLSLSTKRGIAGTMESADQTLEHYRLHADVCRVLTDPKRLMLLAALRAGGRSVGDLAATIGVALPNASQHLAVLRAAGLVASHRMGTTVVYRLAEPTIADACDIISEIVARRVGTVARSSASVATHALIPATQE
jgi:ArsR family transcriptional regulator, virulence genes transcriptional regulator